MNALINNALKNSKQGIETLVNTLKQAGFNVRGLKTNLMYLLRVIDQLADEEIEKKTQEIIKKFLNNNKENILNF